jgi:aryl-alcohol dehydrogenase-like predicted oxidoreductase
MERRPIGASGLEASRIGLGVMPMTWAYLDAATDDPVRVIARAVELGVTHFDTADVYGPFTNEELLGRVLAELGVRREVVIATKVGLRVGPSGGYPLVRDAHPERIVRELEGSLRRLRTDVVDLYYLHRVDERVPFDEQWGALASLVQAGKVRSIGLSEVSVEQLEQASRIHPVAAVQSELSLWTREPLKDVVPWCERHGAAFVPFAPLGRGYLAGSVTSAAFDQRDFRTTNPRFTAEAIEGNRPIVEVVRRVAERVGATPAQVALAWVLARGEHVLPIPGTKRLRHLEENVAAGVLALSAADLAELDAAPAAVAPRY